MVVRGQGSNNQLTDGGKVVSFMCWPYFTPPQEDSSYSFLLGE
jgi:hypothetical protein